MSKVPASAAQKRMKASTLPEGPLIGDIHLAGGKVYVYAAPGALSADPRIEIGAQVRPLELDRSGGRDIPIALTIPLVLNPVQTAEYVLSINALSDWFVKGTQTAQIHVSSGHPPMTIDLAGPLVVPTRGAPIRFEARLAAHRALADLCLTLTETETGKQTVLTIPFDPGYLGGTEADTFQHVLIDLPKIAGDYTIHLTAQFRAELTSDATFPSFLFVSSPAINLGQPEQKVVPVSTSVAAISGGVWLTADLPSPRLNAHDVVLVCCGGAQIPAFKALSHRITCENNYGHFIDLRASEPGDFVLLINGKPETPLHLGPELTGVRIPVAHLTGDNMLLQLFDSSGSQLLWSDWIFVPRILTPVDILQRESTKPFPQELFAQTSHRNRALRAHVAAESPPEIMRQLETAIDALEAGHENLRLKPLAFPEQANPVVSVIIPAHNKVRVTYACLAALLLAHNEASFEVILVDDASNDQTAEIEDLISGITVVRNVEPQRFIRACNAGVAAARGRYVALLNNDTEPTNGWLDELIGAFDRFEKVGLVGSKLLYPDGKLQDAGGIVWGSGNPWNYGSRQNPWEPRFCYARQADYLSGAALMTTKDIWNEVSGLSTYLEPMYFEDTDLAFKIRAAGYATWFVPTSIVYHYEGMTSGTDTSSGFKRFQEVNRPIFKRRWAQDYAGGGKEGVAPDLAKDRNIVGRVLFIDTSAPVPDRDAGGYAAVQEIRLVQSLGYKVTFLPENLAHMASRTTDLEKMGVEMIVAPFYRSVEEFLAARGAEFDAVYITRFHVANSFVDQIRRLAPLARIILNNADLHFLRLLRAALAAKDTAELTRIPAVRAQEMAAMQKVDLVLSYNEVEHAVIQSHSDVQMKVMKCPWVVTCPDVVPARDGRAGISFLGSFNHHPNLDGVEWFAGHVMPLLETAHPVISLSIYGSGMNARVRKLKTDLIEPVGYIDDASDAYDRHLVFVAPLLSGAGIKGKVLTALARGTPCVLSPVAAEGIGLRNGADCIIATKPEDWVSAIGSLVQDAGLWTRLSENGRALARAQFSFGRAREQMRQAFEAVDLYGSRA